MPDQTLHQRIEACLVGHERKQLADRSSRPGFILWSDGCTGCNWIAPGRGIHADERSFTQHVATALTNLLIDMAGHGELLKSIDGMYR